MSLRLVTRSIWENPGNRGQRLRRTLGAVHWQLHKRALAKPREIRLVNGVRFQAYPDCVVSSSLMYAEWPEYWELQFLRRTLQRGDLVIDVGANVGHISLLLADVVGAENICAFEPTPISFQRLAENWKLNGWPAEQLFQMAVGRGNGSVRFPDTSRPETKNAVGMQVNSSRSVEVPMVSLDTFRARWQNRRVGLLKVDVEGYEKEVFAGATGLLRADRPRVVMFESLSGVVEPDLGRILVEAKYDIFELDETGRAVFNRHTAQNLFAVPTELRGLLS